MISTLIPRAKHSYRCSNCMMLQPTIEPNCWYCGNLFSNFESIAIKEFKENESNLRRQNTDKDRIQS